MTPQQLVKALCVILRLRVSYRLLLIQEKEQLLRELRSIGPKGRNGEDMHSVNSRIQQLERDLTHAMQISSRQIADRSVSQSMLAQSLLSFLREA